MLKDECLTLLKREIKPAVGCTEPAAIALAATRTVAFLNESLESMRVELSGNIYKNAFAVTIPGTSESGVELSAALGAVLDGADRELELFDGINQSNLALAKAYLKERRITAVVADPVPEKFYIHIIAEGKDNLVETWTEKNHTNMTRALFNGMKIPVCPDRLEDLGQPLVSADLLSLELLDLVRIVESFSADEIAFLKNSVTMNQQMAAEGMERRAGMGLGHGLKDLMDLKVLSGDLITQVRIAVASASDGRMGGIKQPVMSTTGSGNQGILVSLPIAIVAQNKKLSEEKLLKGLALGNLVTAYVKQYIGKLAPICGCAIAAGIGVAAAVAWMLGGSIEQIEGATRNMMANLAGMICDGAKGGCSFKLASSASESVLAAFLALGGTIVAAEDGIVSESLRETVENITILCKKGMENQDEAIISILQNKQRVHAI